MMVTIEVSKPARTTISPGPVLASVASGAGTAVGVLVAVVVDPPPDVELPDVAVMFTVQSPLETPPSLSVKTTDAW